MTITITSSQLATLVAAGTENNPVVGIDDLFDRPGSFTGGGATASRVGDEATYTYWTAETTTDSVSYEADASITVDMVAVAAHNAADLGAGIAPQYYNGTSWTNMAGGYKYPTDNKPMIWLHDDITATHFRLLCSSPTTVVSIGVAFFGRALRFDQRFYRGYDEARYPSEVELLANQSGPHTLGTSVIGRGSSVQWDLQHLPEADVYTDDFAKWVSRFNSGRGIFSAWRPADYGTAYYGVRQGDPIRLVNSGPKKRKSMSFGMRVYNE